MVVLLAVVALVGGPGRSDAQAVPAPVHEPGLAEAASAMFLPASYVDLQTALPLENFFDHAASKLITACLARHGFDVQFPYAPRRYNYSDANSLFPDLKSIARGGVLTPADFAGDKEWIPPVPPDELRAFEAVLGTCGRAVSIAEREGTARWLALEEEWVAADAKGDSDAVYERLVAKFAACVGRRGYEGTTPVEFLMGIDHLMQESIAAGEPRSEQEAISLGAGTVYAICYRAGNARRQAVRRRALFLFLDRHALDMQRANRQLRATVARLSEETGVRFGDN